MPKKCCGRMLELECQNGMPEWNAGMPECQNAF